MTDTISDLRETKITTVLLSSNAAAQKQFLKALQAALDPDGTLSSLTPGYSEDVYVIPHPVQGYIRRKLRLFAFDDADWEAWLQKQGALAVNVLYMDAYIALMTRGTTVVGGKFKGPSNLKVPVQTRRSAEAQPGFSHLNLVGPYDWHLGEHGVKAVAAWKMFSDDGRFPEGVPWGGIRVAHIDTGYTEHVALGWSGGRSPFVLPADGRDFWRQDDGADGPRDPFLNGFPGHGTRISAGIAGFYPQAPQSPFYGVAPGAQIVPFRVTDSVIVDHVQANIRDAIEAAIEADCQVVNISLGALRRSSSLSRALDRAYEQGLIVVCAAGQVWGEVIYPGRFNRCLTMGGVGPGLVPWRSAARGPYVDLCAPADGIRRVRPEHLVPGKAGERMEPKTGDGTSYATAMASGAAVLWLAWHGLDTLRKQYGPDGLWQIPKAFKYLAMRNATPGNWRAADEGNYGAGVLNIAALLRAPLPAPGSMRPENLANGEMDDCSL